MRALVMAVGACAMLHALPVAAQAEQSKHLAASQEDQQPGILLRFQLIAPTDARSADPAIGAIDAALKDLFRFPGYRLMSQAAVMMERPAPAASNGRGGQSMATQMLNGDGEIYKLTVYIDSTTAQTVRMNVLLMSVPRPGTGGASSTLFSTSVEVSFGHTVVLGSTQPAATTTTANETLILAVRAESRQAPPGDVPTGRGPEFIEEKVDEPPVALNCAAPVYPSELRGAGIHGTVTLRYAIGTDGKVDQATMKVVNSSNKAFEQPAIDAILSCAFTPAKINKTPVRHVVQHVVRFAPG